MEYSIFSVFGLLRFCFRYRFLLLFVCVLSIIISSVVALFFIPQKFKSVAVIAPTTTSSISQALLIEDNPYKKDIFEFGEDEDTEGFMQVLTSDLVRDIIIERFNLYTHYKINKDDPLAKTWINLEYEDNFTFKKTNLGSIQIIVFDEYPDKAAEMANLLVDSIIDQAYLQVRSQRAKDNLAICQARKISLEDELMLVSYTLTNLRKKYGIVYPENQVERLTEQKAIAFRENAPPSSIEKIQAELNILSTHATEHDLLRNKSLEIHTELHRIDQVVALADIELTEPFKSFFIIDRAYPAEKKSKPIRWLIVLGSCLSTLFFTIIGINLFLVIKKIKNEA